MFVNFLLCILRVLLTKKHKTSRVMLQNSITCFPARRFPQPSLRPSVPLGSFGIHPIDIVNIAAV